MQADNLDSCQLSSYNYKEKLCQCPNRSGSTEIVNILALNLLALFIFQIYIVLGHLCADDVLREQAAKNTQTRVVRKKLYFILFYLFLAATFNVSF